MSVLTNVFLSREERQNIRDLAREDWIYSSNQEDFAIELVSQRIQEGSWMRNRKRTGLVGSVLSAILIKLAIELAVMLIRRWLENREFLPSTAYQVGEPGY